MSKDSERYLLILEDSQTLAHLARKKIEEHTPYSTVCATTLEQALSLLDSGEYAFEKALVDLTLPDAAGEEIIDALQPYQLHMIVMTGTFGKEWRGILQGKNVVDYFIKNKINSYDEVIACLNRLDRNTQVQILVVDDSISYRSLVKRMLGLQNYQVLQASSGAEALEMLAANPNIQLVITDYMMKDMNGIMLTETIRQKFKPHRLGLIGISATELSCSVSQGPELPIFYASLLRSKNSTAGWSKTFNAWSSLNSCKSRLMSKNHFWALPPMICAARWGLSIPIASSFGRTFGRFD